MLIPFKEIVRKYNMKINGVIQVGVHHSEEHDEYLECGISKFIYIEPCAKAYQFIIDKFIGEDAKKYYDKEYATWGSIKKEGDKQISQSVSILNFACSDKEGLQPMYVSHQNEGQSNSLLQPKLHLEQHKEIIFDDAEVVRVAKLDTLMNKYVFSITPKEERNILFNMLVMDVQGAEGLVLKGATETLNHIDYIYTEINTGETYEGNMLVGEMDKFLEPFGFIRVETFLPSPNWTWGDGIFIRKTLL